MCNLLGLRHQTPTFVTKTKVGVLWNCAILDFLPLPCYTVAYRSAVRRNDKYFYGACCLKLYNTPEIVG